MAYQNFIRIPPELFQELEQRLTPEHQTERTWMMEPLSPGLKLAVTLRHLANRDSYPTMKYAFRVARLTINKFVPEACDAIIRAYQDEVMMCPTSPEDWLEIKSVFCQRWNIPMPWVPWMESPSQSDVQDRVAASTTTTRASTLLYS